VRKLGLIAGGGGLPVSLARQCRSVGRPIFILRLKGMANPDLAEFPGVDVGLAELGKCLKALRESECEAICFAGQVHRPDFSALKPDLRGLKALPGVIAAAAKGDDALLRFLISEFEREGFHVEGAHEVFGGLTLGQGPLGRVAPTARDRADIDKGFFLAGEIGRLDIGQGVVICGGLALAVEAQEGTDVMLARCAALPAALRGGDGRGPMGVLVKRPKSIQEERVDLPTIGLETIEGAARAGLAGVVGETGKVLVVDREAVVAAADALGVFVYGMAP
jgi:DUF1009 family protein